MLNGLSALQCSFDDILISDLVLLLQNVLPERTFHIAQQSFYHDPPDAGEIAASQSSANETLRQCGGRCLLDVHEFVLQEASTGFKEYVKSFDSMLRGFLRLKAMKNFGFAPVYNTLMKIRLHQSITHDRDRGGKEGRGGEERRLDNDDKDNGARQVGDGNYVENSVIEGEDYRIEAGGGSGMGFQLFCDGTMVLTAGGGGGGKHHQIH